MEEYMWPIILGTSFGFIGRLILLKTDYRQYPTSPHGNIIHLALGFIAAGLGSIAIPALVEEEFTAITFLALAATQFREVRNMERETLTEMDSMEMVSRGKTYIEGIAMAFEGRNYLIIIIAFFTSMLTLFIGWWAGVIVGGIGIALAIMYKSGKRLSKISTIEKSEVRFEGNNLYVGDIHIMNVGLTVMREIIEENGMGLIVHPKTLDSNVTLSNFGQRQAVIHDLAVGLGVYRDEDKPSLIPLSRRDLEDGRIAFFFLPQIYDIDQAVEVIARVPILENAVRIPSESDANRSRKGG